MNKKTNKTAHVLKLLSNSENLTKENPILNEEFKDEMIIKRNKSEKIEERIQAPQSISQQQDKKVGVNIISSLIDDNLMPVLERFRCCTCELCKSQITVLALNQIPPQYIYVSDSSSNEVKKLKEKYKTSVVTVLVKIALQIKNNPIHN